MSKRKLLFVDDDPTVRTFFTNIFLSTMPADIEAVVCDSIESAKTAFATDFDVVVCDYLLNESQDGLDFFRYAIAANPSQQFVIFTGADDRSVRPIVNEQEAHENLYLAVGKDWELLKQMLMTILED